MRIIHDFFCSFASNKSTSDNFFQQLKDKLDFIGISQDGKYVMFF